MTLSDESDLLYTREGDIDVLIRKTFRIIYDRYDDDFEVLF